MKFEQNRNGRKQTNKQTKKSLTANISKRKFRSLSLNVSEFTSTTFLLGFSLIVLVMFNNSVYHFSQLMEMHYCCRFRSSLMCKYVGQVTNGSCKREEAGMTVV